MIFIVHFKLLLKEKIAKNIADLAVCQKSCINLDALPHNFPRISKPCPPSNESNLDPKDNGSKLTLIEQLTLMEKGDRRDVWFENQLVYS